MPTGYVLDEPTINGAGSHQKRVQGSGMSLPVLPHGIVRRPARGDQSDFCLTSSAPRHIERSAEQYHRVLATRWDAAFACGCRRMKPAKAPGRRAGDVAAGEQSIALQAAQVL